MLSQVAARGTRQHRRVGVSVQLIGEQLTEADTDSTNWPPTQTTTRTRTVRQYRSAQRRRHGASDNSAVFMCICVLDERRHGGSDRVPGRETVQVLRRV